MEKSTNPTINIELEEQRELLHKQLLSSVSHDLKTPLSVIIGTLELYNSMSSTLDEKTKKELLSSGLNEAYRLDNFITNILDMAKLEAGAIKPRKQIYDLRRLLEDTARNAGYKYKEATITCFSDVESEEYETDAALLSRAITLLIDNSAKFGGKPPKVHIFLESSKKDVSIFVNDNGNGVSENIKDKIFDKYSRMQNEDRQNAGTGLGLSIARGLIELIGGKISLVDDFSKKDLSGAVFKIEFSKK